MYGLLTAIHLIICFALVVSVLLQSGKGGGLAGAFGGGGGAQTIFGGRGAATFLSKATTALGALFLLTALLLAMIPRGGEGPAKSLIQEQAREAEAPPPAAAPEGTAPLEGLPGEGALPAEETPLPGAATPDQDAESGSGETQPTPSGGGTEDNREQSNQGP